MMTAVVNRPPAAHNLLLQVLPPALETVAAMVGCELLIDTPTPAAAPMRDDDIALSLPLSGALTGDLILLFSPSAGQILTSRLLNNKQDLPLSGLALSVLQEFGNILASGLVMELDQQFSRPCQLHPPQVISTLPEEVGEEVFIRSGSEGGRDNLQFRACLCLAIGEV